ncbi:MAG: formiminotransferase, partial [Aquificota bacterium]
SPSRKCVAQVGSSCITVREYQRELLRYSNLMQNKEMESIIKEQVLSGLIAQALLYEKAKELSLVASDEEVVEVIKSDPTFAEGGVFSSSKYKEVLARSGLSPEEYEENIRKLLSIQKLISLLTNSVYVTDKERDTNISVQSVLLNGRLYIISPSEVKLDYQPSDKELFEFYQKNKELFKTQGERVVLLWREKDKEKASNIYKELKEGKIPQGYQELKLPKQEEELSPLLKAQAQRLSNENRADLLKEGDAYVVLYLKELKPPGYENFEEVKEKVKEKLLEEKRLSLLEAKAKEVVESLRKGTQVNYKSLNFSDTPAQQLTAVIDIDQKDFVNILFSKDKV